METIYKELLKDKDERISKLLSVIVHFKRKLECYGLHYTNEEILRAIQTGKDPDERHLYIVK